MAEIKFTKNELRLQQQKLGALQKYLPTLQLKKAMLQLEVHEARLEIHKFDEDYQKEHRKVDQYAALLTDQSAIEPAKAASVKELKKRYENIAGVEVPYFEDLTFHEFSYDLFDTPPWVDQVVLGLRGLVASHTKVEIAKEKKIALEKELREVSIRVNLFEKILIPRALANIKKIRVFLGDLQLAAVSQAKVAKNKIEENKEAAVLARKQQQR
jgi:V/A-type H+-transporting ATPase subunit D